MFFVSNLKEKNKEKEKTKWQAKASVDSKSKVLNHLSVSLIIILFEPTFRNCVENFVEKIANFDDTSKHLVMFWLFCYILIYIVKNLSRFSGILEKLLFYLKPQTNFILYCSFYIDCNHTEAIPNQFASDLSYYIKS